MNLNQLAEKALRGQVNLDSGAKEQVDYVHYSSNSRELDVNCFPQKINEGELAKDTERSYVQFHAMFLNEKPKRGDSISWNGEAYHYEKIMAQTGDSSYDVLASSSTHSPRGSR